VGTSSSGSAPTTEVGAAGPRPWAIVQHVAFEGPGLIAASLGHLGLRFDIIRTDRGDALPEPASIGGLVVMGGPMGVRDGDHHPWLAPERTLMATAVEAGLPVLGVCLGAQQLAMALGAEVTTGPTEEIGLGQVELTGAGRMDPVTGPEYGGLAHNALPCVHWHQDTFSLPDGAVHLAATRPFPHQAFRWGPRAYGFQFHVEVDRTLAAAWRPHLPVGTLGDDAGLARVESVGRRLLHRFVERSVAADRAPTLTAEAPPVEPAEGR
jgi:GMP synthase-like glutamine amidotransferase